MKITEMTKEDFLNVPWRSEVLKGPHDMRFNSFVIIPTDEKHESGYMCMEFVAVDDETVEPGCRMSGVSDVVELDGIGGYGDDLNSAKRIDGKIHIEPKGWKIDCLPCGYLRIFARGKVYVDDPFALSSFEIYAE